MSIEALILGKLHQPAETRTSKAGREFVSAKVTAAAGDAGSLFVNVVAFSDTACRALMALEAGDSLALAGTLTPGAWIDREGNAKPSINLVAAQVMTTYGLKKKRDATAELGTKQGAAAAPAPRRPSGQTESLSLDEDDAWLRGEA